MAGEWSHLIVIIIIIIISPERPLPATGIPRTNLRICEPHCLSLAATSSSQLAYVQI